MNWIKELQDFIAGQETDITEFDEALVKKLIVNNISIHNHSLFLSLFAIHIQLRQDN